MFELQIQYKKGSYVISYMERKATSPLFGFFFEKWDIQKLRFENGII